MEFEKITRQELMANIHTYRQQLEGLLAEIPREDYLAPIFAEGWSVKDILAHIVAWEQKMIIWIGQAAEGQLPEMPKSDEAVNDLNAAFHEENKGLSLEEVLLAFERSFPQALAAAENTPDGVLFTENLFEGREHPFWITVAANTWWHYKDHIEDITNWLQKRTGD